MRLRSPFVLVLLLCSVVPAGRLATASAADAYPTCDQSTPTFSAPIRLGQDQGYEPGIDIDSAGTIFITAHDFFPAGAGVYEPNDQRLQSWLFKSTDDGKTFTDVQDPIVNTKLIYGDEGDIDVDANDKLYFVDTYLADNQFYRFGGHGSTLELYKPGVPSWQLDDRPWITAHGDGHVFYMGNGAYGPVGRYTIQRSTDGGLTFDEPGFTFPKSGWGFLDADPNSSYVYAFFNDQFYATSDALSTPGPNLTIWISPDDGVSWHSVHVATYQNGYSQNYDRYPIVAVSPVDGTVYTFWSDGDENIFLGRSSDHGETWTIEDVSPYTGYYAFPWVSVSPTGQVGLTWEGHKGTGTSNYIYAMIWNPSADCLRVPGDLTSLCTGPSASYARISANTGGPDAQTDFFQNKFAPDGTLNVPYTDTTQQRYWLMFTRQSTGSNLSGSRPCGVVGTP